MSLKAAPYVMERGFLARESARAPPVKEAHLSFDLARESGFGGDESLQHGDSDDSPSGPSQENLAFFEHDGFEPPYDVVPRKRDSFSKLEELLREESPKKRFRWSPTKSPSPPNSMFKSLDLRPKQQSNVSSGSNTPHKKGKASRPRIQIQRTKKRETSNTKLRQATLTKYLPMRKTLKRGKSVDREACNVEAISSPPFPGLFTNAAAQSLETEEPLHVEARKSRLPEDFVVSIKLEPAEERFLVRFKYMYESAVKKLSHAPPFPEGVQPFQSSMLEVQSDATTSHSEHLILQQALCAGRGAVQVYWGESAKEFRETPDWARLPSSLPGTFLKRLAEFLLHKNMLIVVHGASLNHLCRLSEKLRSLGVPTKYSSERLPFDNVELSCHNLGVWLVNYDHCPEDGRQNRFDGVILPQGTAKWSGLPCGTLHIDIDPEFSNLAPRRTAFVDRRFKELIERLRKRHGLETDSKSLSRYGVDLCSGDLGVIFSHENLAESIDEEIFTRIIRRVLRAASFFRFLVILCVSSNKSIDRLREITRLVEAKGIQSECRIQVVDARESPVEDTIEHFCDIKGDDLADLAFLTLRNSALASIFDEGNPTQTPHATLVAALL